MAGRVPELLHARPESAAARAQVGEATAALESLGRDLQPTDVARLFFAAVNVEALQHGIRYGVYRQSGGARLVVGRQSDRELGIIMRSVYLQQARNSATASDLAALLAQVRELNAHVLQYCVPRVAREALMYRTYLRDASTLPDPLPRSELATMKGQRTLELKSFM